MTAEPIAHGTNGMPRLVIVSAYILARDIRTELSIAVSIAVEHQASLLPVSGRAVTFRSQKKSELERHVEPGELRVSIDTGTGNVVDAELRLSNNFEDFIAVDDFECRASYESAIVDGKYDCVGQTSLL